MLTKPPSDFFLVILSTFVENKHFKIQYPSLLVAYLENLVWLKINTYFSLFFFCEPLYVTRTSVAQRRHFFLVWILAEKRHLLCLYRDTYQFMDRPCFGLNWSATCALEVSAKLWGHFVQIWVSHLVDWFATCHKKLVSNFEVTLQLAV